jgi:TRAP-type C4-dicarboxylate transport system substrate-binding protein
MNKAIWDKLPEDLKTILKVSVDKLAYDLVFNLKKLDLEAIQAAKKDASIELVNMAPEERAKFRQIAQQEWKVWAAKNEMTQKVYDAAVKFLTERNLM